MRKSLTAYKKFLKRKQQKFLVFLLFSFYETLLFVRKAMRNLKHKLILLNHSFIPLKNISMIKDSKARLLFFPFGINVKGIQAFSKEETDVKKENPNMYVVFNRRARICLEKLGLDVYSFSDVSTNIDIDIEIQSSAQKELKNISSNYIPIKVEYYDNLVNCKRFSYFLNNKPLKHRSVNFIFSCSDMSKYHFKEVLYFIEKQGYKCSQIVGIRSLFFLLKEPCSYIISIKKAAKVLSRRMLMNLLFMIKTYNFLSFKIKRIVDSCLKINSKLLKIKASKNVPKSYPIAIFFAGNPVSKYARVLFKVIEGFEKDNVNYICITENYWIHLCLRAYGYTSLYLKLPFKTALKNVANDSSYNTFWKYYSLSRSRILEYLKNTCNTFKIKKIILLPHWSALGSLAFSLPRENGIKLVSLPVVTVADNCASIIGWEELDEIYCYGTQCVSAFKNMQYLEKKLTLCGNLLLAQYINREVKQRNQILIATSRIDPNENLWIEKVIKYSIHHGYQCIIKVHPSFSKHEYLDLYKRGNHNPKIIIDLDTDDYYELIQQSAICITDCSTVGAEAVLLDKNLLVVNLLQKEFGANRYAEMGVALEAKTLDEVCVFLDQILSGHQKQKDLRKNYPKFFDLYDYYHDGKATQRFVNAMTG